MSEYTLERIKQRLRFNKNTPITRIAKRLMHEESASYFLCGKLDDSKMSDYEKSINPDWAMMSIPKATCYAVEGIIMQICAQVYGCRTGFTSLDPDQYQLFFSGHAIRVEIAVEAYHAIHRAMDERCRKYIGELIHPLHKKTIINESLARSYCELYGQVLYGLTSILLWRKFRREPWGGVWLWEQFALNRRTNKIAELVADACETLHRDQNKDGQQKDVIKIIHDVKNTVYERFLIDLCATLFKCPFVCMSGYQGQEANVLAAVKSFELLRKHIELRSKSFINYLQCCYNTPSFCYRDVQEKFKVHYGNVLAIRIDSALRYRGIQP
ncbi:DUF7168 domain-containing protein [Snodgrassella communis]|uniref:DUF7168 domain-containing protein n=1 Tax=Snodgrassella communis TaxID=2946699 RepID=UPI000C1DFEAB|nr:hypothetical protein [Snodgrassella communis]PIT09941.1 hypothetical protein BGI31_02000 [Snodgrassella communis]